MDVKLEVQKKAALVEQQISPYLPKEEGLQKTIFEAVNYSLRAGGKRLRPMLMKEVYDLYGGQDPAISCFMAAIEMIHTYSLVHDDLPAMDNDRLRRGKDTTWVVYGEGMATLAGDALLNLAFETAAGAFAVSEHPERCVKALQILGKKAGMQGMIGGQVVDVESEGKQISIETLQFIHKLKTCALIEASMMIGAVLAGADETQLQKVEEAASEIGMAFQIQDDILDVIGSEEVLGKPIGSDEENEKTTYITLIGLEQSQAEVVRRSDHAVSLLKSAGRENPFLTELIYSLAGRDR